MHAGCCETLRKCKRHEAQASFVTLSESRATSQVHVWITLPSSPIPSLSQISLHPAADLLATIKTINSRRAQGLDKISAKVLVECAEQIFPSQSEKMLLGRCIINNIVDHITINLSNLHFDFLKGRSTTTQLLCTRGRLHGSFSTPGLNSALLTGLKFFTITRKISTPGVEMLYVHRPCWRILHFVSCNK